MSDFAFIGTEGCGKTVLITALSRLYRPTSDQVLQLNPANKQTASYVDRAWQALKRSEWPPSTPPGQRTNLEWHFQFTSGYCGRMRLLDSAGQDLRQLFAEEGVRQVGDLPGPLQSLAEEIAAARAIVFLVNLHDFLGEKDPEKRLDNEWLVWAAMEFRELVRPGAPKCLVFTQSDLYRSQLSNPAGLRSVAFHYLPHVSGMYLQDGTVPLFAVSAVGKTINVPDEDGIPRRVPDGKLHCSGFRELVGWMENCMRTQPASGFRPEKTQTRPARSNPEWSGASQPPTPSSTSRPPSPPPTTSTPTYVSTGSQQWPKITEAEVGKFLWGLFFFVVVIMLPMLRSCNQRAEQKKNLDKIIKDVQGR